MRLEFKLGELHRVLSEYKDVLDDSNLRATEEVRGNVLKVTSFRIVVPGARSSYRFGTWFSYDKSKNVWGERGTVNVRYREEEQDPNYYVGFDNSDFEVSVYSTCMRFEMDDVRVKELDCYIDIGEQK